jgi:hypothetical protein
MGRACSTNGEKRNAYRILVKKPEIKRSLEIPRCRRVDRSWRQDGVVWTGLVSLRIRTGGGPS